LNENVFKDSPFNKKDELKVLEELKAIELDFDSPYSDDLLKEEITTLPNQSFIDTD